MRNRRLFRGHQCQLSSSNHWLRNRGTAKSSANIEQGQTVNGSLASPLVYVMLLLLVSLMLFNCYRLLYLIYLTWYQDSVWRIVWPSKIAGKICTWRQREINKIEDEFQAFSQLLSLNPFCSLGMWKCCSVCKDKCIGYVYASGTWAKRCKTKWILPASYIHRPTLLSLLTSSWQRWWLKRRWIYSAL